VAEFACVLITIEGKIDPTDMSVVKAFADKAAEAKAIADVLAAEYHAVRTQADEAEAKGISRGRLLFMQRKALEVEATANAAWEVYADAQNAFEAVASKETKPVVTRNVAQSGFLELMTRKISSEAKLTDAERAEFMEAYDLFNDGDGVTVRDIGVMLGALDFKCASSLTLNPPASCPASCSAFSTSTACLLWVSSL
jgi:hypothetical protein